jgi:hypothetical protein
MSYNSFGDNFNNPMANLGQAVGNIKGGVTSGLGKFKNNKYVAGASEFLYSNSLVAKVTFLLLAVLIFIFAMRIGSQVLAYAFSPNPNPILLNGMKDGKKFLRIRVDPRLQDSVPILKSKNQREGTTFTYSVWLYINTLVYQAGKRKHIFHKGSDKFGAQQKWRAEGGEEINTAQMAFPNNSPGLFLHEDKNEFIIAMNTFNNVLEEIKVPNIPLQKWINIIIRVHNLNMDVFINGDLAVRHVFSAPVKQNHGDIFMSANNGFDGLMSGLRYFNSSLSGTAIKDLVREGPDMRSDNSMNVFPPYLSLRWFFQGENV